MNNIFKIFFYISINFFLFSSGWYFSWTDHLLFFLFLKYFTYFLILLLIVFCFWKKKKFRIVSIIFLLSFFIGHKTYDKNFFKLNNYIYSSLMQIKYNSFGYQIFKIKEILLENFNLRLDNKAQKQKYFSIDNIEINEYFTENVAINVDDVGNFVIKKDSDKYKLSKLFPDEKNDKSLTPIYINRNEAFLIKNHVSNKSIVSSLSYYKKKDLSFKREWIIDSTEIGFHHWGDYFDGNIYVPGRDFISLPNEYSKNFLGSKYGKCNLDNSWNEFITIYEAKSSNLIKKIYIMPLLAQVKKKDFNNFLFKCMNPIHFNDIQILKKESHANFFENGKVGDILISLRNIHTLALLDKDTQEIKWIVSGLFKQQHSPRVTDNGSIIIFDNLGSDKKNGQSKITEISISQKKVIGFYEATGNEFFESVQRGRLQLMNDKIFVQNHEEGELFYLNCKNSKNLSNNCDRVSVLKADNIIFNLTDIIN